MATSNILGLFTSPEQYQAQQLAQQQANEQQRAINFAGLDPRGQANYGVFLGAQQLGRGFAGLLGVQDPQLQRIRQRDQLMQSINPADPESLMAGIQAATNAGDQELALTLTDFMNRQGSEMALARQRQAQADRERTQALPAGIQEAARIAEIERTLATLDKVKNKTEYDALTAEKGRLQRSARAATATQSERDATAYANTISDDPESKAWQTAYKERLDRLQLGAEGAPKISSEAQKLIDAGYIPGSPMFVSMMDRVIEKGLAEKEGGSISFGADRESIAAELYGKPFKDLTQAEKAKVNQRKEAEDNTRAERGAAKLVMPGQTKEGPKGISGFRNEVIQSVKPFRDMVTGADSALASIKDSIANKNYISFNAARTQLAKALGDTSLSRRDIEQAGADPSILGGLYDRASTLFTGTPSPDTQAKIESTLKIIRKVALKKANDELAVQRKLGKRAGYTDEDMADAFDFPEFKGAGTQQSGNRKAVPFNSLPKGEEKP
jgi:hypothetical protein